MFNLNPNNAPIFQGQQINPQANQSQPNVQNTSSDPFDKLLNKSLNEQSNKQITTDTNLENYRKQIEQLDLEQLRMERRRLVDLIVKYMNEGKRDLLDEAQKKYKIAVQVSDSKVMNFSAASIAEKKQEQNIAQVSKDDFLKKLQESDILPPDNSTPPTIPQQTSISQQNNIINTTDTQVSSANPNVQMLSIPNINNQTNLQGMVNPNQGQNFQQQSLINTLNSMNPNQINTLFSNPQGIFNSLNTLNNTNQAGVVGQSVPMNPGINNPFNPSFSNILLNAVNPVNPFSPLITSYGVYAPGLRNNPTMNAYLNGELYPTDMADLGVWSVLNKELFTKNEE